MTSAIRSATDCSLRRRSQVVRQRFAKPPFVSSILTGASSLPLTVVGSSVRDGQSKPMRASKPGINVELLKEHLVEVSSHEAELTDHVYQNLFAKRPDAEELFGRYSQPNQQRMMTETPGRRPEHARRGALARRVRPRDGLPPSVFLRDSYRHVRALRRGHAGSPRSGIRGRTGRRSSNTHGRRRSPGSTK